MDKNFERDTITDEYGQLSNLLKKFNLTIKSFDDMISTMKGHNIGKDIIIDIEKIKQGDYRNLREWSLKHILNRYEKCISEYEKIGDYFTELTDRGFLLSIDQRNKEIHLKDDGVSGTKVEKLAEVVNVFLHLNKSRRLKCEIYAIEGMGIDNTRILEFWGRYVPRKKKDE